MSISSDIIESSIVLGNWLNKVAYVTAIRELKKDSKDNKLSDKEKNEKIRQLKAKTLVELESAAFSSKSGHALISQVVTRAGRLTGEDAPNEASLFMKAVVNETISLKEAQNLITAFSRVRSENKEKLNK